MRVYFLVATLFFLTISWRETKAQAYIKTSYFHNVEYEDEEGLNSGEGNLINTVGGFSIPFSVKMEEKKMVDVWHFTTDFKHAKFNEPLNKRPFDELLNVNMRVSNIRSLSDRWSLLTSLGGGISYENTKVSSLRWDNVMLHGLGVAIYQVSPSVKLGGGLILTNVFSTPMVFPTFYVGWNTNGKYSIELKKLVALNFTAGMKLNDAVKLNWIIESNRTGTPTEVGGEKMYMGYKYYATGFHPEFSINKKLTIPLTIGFSANSSTTYKEREIKSFLDNREKYKLSPAPYISIGLVYNIHGNRKK